MENGGGSGQRQARAGLAYLAFALIGAGAAIGLALIFHLGEAEAAVTVASGLAPAYLAWSAYRVDRREASDIADSRRRVRQAEQGLERALRPSGSVTLTYGDAEITVRGGENASDLVQQLQQFLDRGDGSPTGNGSPEPTDANGREDSVSRDPSTRAEAVPPNERNLLTLSELWTLTHARLDHYHGIALSQAKRSFRNAQIAMGIGFTLLFAFVIVALTASTTTGSVVAGALGGVSAALAGYVSGTFVRSQEASAGHLRAYFEQPLEFARYLAAERLAADAKLSDAQRAEIVTSLVQAMVSGTTASPPNASADTPPSTT
ncbi:hypothetical protein [Streptomyces sp. NPDC001435]|uniref:TRADD-N-associated membrane domain-containing protein n=1 Tax=unclassified Streptomyces TaxID=2593676 RepID=UPI0036A50CB6